MNKYLKIYNKLDSIFIHGKYSDSKIFDHEHYDTDFETFIKEKYVNIDTRLDYKISFYYVVWKILSELLHHLGLKAHYTSFRSIKMNRTNKRIFLYDINTKLLKKKIVIKPSPLVSCKTIYRKFIDDLIKYEKNHDDRFLSCMLEDKYNMKPELFLTEMERLINIKDNIL